MCGILGYYAFGSKIPTKKIIEEMFCLLERRGKDASGYAFIRENRLHVFKSPIESSKLILTDQWKSLELPRIMIMHSRMMTQGNVSNNNNNHPLFNKQGLCIVHNGQIFNDSEILYKKKRDGEVDSEAILSLLSNKSKDSIKELFDNIIGSFAVAVIDRQRPDMLTLIRKDSPIVLYYNHEDEILYFASEREIMSEPLKIKQQTNRGFNIGEANYHAYNLENNHSLEINNDGVVSYKQYFTKNLRDDYFQDDEVMIECPWCREMTSYNYTHRKSYCDNCSMELNEEDIYV